MSISLDALQSRVHQAWYAMVEPPRITDEMAPPYLLETYDTHIIVGLDETHWEIDYTDGDDGVVFAPRAKWREVKREWVPAKNALKAVSRTADELRVGNHIVLWNTRDLEGLGSPRVNTDGSRGEYFSPDTEFDSAYTKSVVFVDWEHAEDVDPETGEPIGESLGVVDWKTATPDKHGLWVERVLNRRSQYVRWVEQLIDEGLIGSSSEAVPDGVEKAEDGKIVRWPLKRDTFTVQPMEFRNLKEFGPNHIQAFKALGIPVPEDSTTEPEQEQETEPEVADAAVSVAKARLRCQILQNRLTAEV